ncbi:thermonuclease family protein [Candidatus Daviesbacteria bacterium]|nr:thermonuclease family protein [Candidatus Daviesbacteria bacterium]
MNFKKTLVLTAVLISSVFISSLLIWQGLNLDIKEEQPEVLGSLNPVEEEIKLSTPSAQAQKSFLVTKVIDGDTIEIKSDPKTLKVRLIGIDTPETVDPRRPVGCFGKKASAETKRLIEGKQVILTKDVSETDKYNRLLRYVFLPIGDGENLFINDYLIRQGFAKILTYPPDIKYDSRFLQAEKEAKDNLRGLWGQCK